MFRVTRTVSVLGLNAVPHLTPTVTPAHAQCEQTKLTVPDTATEDGFGGSVAISGAIVTVGGSGVVVSCQVCPGGADFPPECGDPSTDRDVGFTFECRCHKPGQKRKIKG